MLTSRSSPPSSRTASSTKRAQLSGSVTSSLSLTSPSIRSTRRAPPATRAPSRRSGRAVAAPIPLEAPVTIAVLPSSAPTSASLAALPFDVAPELDRRRAGAGDVVDLQRRVLEGEALLQHPLDLPADGMAVALGAAEHVRRERGEAARHRPDVQVVGLDDARHRRDRRADLVRVELPRRDLEEDPRGL